MAVAVDLLAGVFIFTHDPRRGSVPSWVTKARTGCRPVDSLWHRWLGLGFVGAGPVESIIGLPLLK
ncbi:hypothetical protein FH972_005089 [Carpinus fangiana]|uniref:Uncharacterized protein n=1 Tax=Carpinus fangiana TaxID=176857 RepID=A0A5N6QRP0_9ROSI|nr:hypothetical protein FH972_005089 [Carpinus fangiana]